MNEVKIPVQELRGQRREGSFSKGAYCWDNTVLPRAYRLLKEKKA